MSGARESGRRNHFLTAAFLGVGNGEWDRPMLGFEKVILLCLIIGVILLLAELSPAARAPRQAQQ
jgi:hypothetical protein